MGGLSMIPIQAKVKMMAIHPSLTRESFTGMSKKGWLEIIKEAWLQAGKVWHKAILPKHFTEAGALEYKYKGRAPIRAKTDKNGKTRYYLAYNTRKQKKWGHQKPLVWSGNLMKQVKQIQDVKNTTKGAKIKLYGPKYLYAYRKDLNQPDKAAELRAISAKDNKEITAVMDSAITSGAAQRGLRVPLRNKRGGHRVP